LPAHCV